MSTAPLTRSKRLAFTGVMLALPVVFFLLLEGGLRLAGYGAAHPLFIPVEDFPDYAYQNPQAAQRYFHGLTNPPTPLQDFFRREKPEGTFRIVVQGGSSAAGYPFYYGGAFSRMLEQRLLQTFPDRPIEVINTAMAAVNSYTLLDFQDEILAIEPDAVLIYAGHNEYYGALGVGSSESLGQNPAFVNLYLRLRPLRTVQLVRNTLGNLAGAMAGSGDGGPPSATLMERMVGEQTIPLGSDTYHAGLRQFRHNLSALLEGYADAGVPVFIGTLAANERDHAPFVDALAPGTDPAAYAALLRDADTALAAADTVAAFDALGRAVALDSLAAEARYRRARLHHAFRDTAAARADFIAAKDRDALRFRAPEAINAVLRDEAARWNATVVETRDALAATTPDGLIGDELMTEHLHPNPNGFFLISDAFYRALQTNALIGEWTQPVPADVARTEVLMTPVDSLVGMYRVAKLKGAWPFQPPGVVDRSLDTLKATNPLEDIAFRLARDEVNWLQANRALQAHYETEGNLQGALKTALARVQQYPLLAEPYAATARLFAAAGRLDEAIHYYEASNDLQETSEARGMIGAILLQRGRTADAVPHLQRAVELDSRNTGALYNLSGAYALSRQFDQARAAATRLLDLQPNHQDARRLLASLPR